MHPRKAHTSLASLVLVNVALWAALPLSAEPLIMVSAPGDRFTFCRGSSGGSPKKVPPHKLQFQFNSRTGCVQAKLMMPGKGMFQIRKIVVHFSNPKDSRASLRSVQLFDNLKNNGEGSNFFEEETVVQGDWASREEFSTPGHSGNAWKIASSPTLMGPILVRLNIAAGMEIDTGGPGPPPPGTQMPRSEPFVLISVDAYFEKK